MLKGTIIEPSKRIAVDVIELASGNLRIVKQKSQAMYVVFQEVI